VSLLDPHLSTWAAFELRRWNISYIEITEVDPSIEVYASGCSCCNDPEVKIEVTIWFVRPPRGREKKDQRDYHRVDPDRYGNDIKSFMKEVLEYGVPADQ
jgi:hypothetical protein